MPTPYPPHKPKKQTTDRDNQLKRILEGLSTDQAIALNAIMSGGTIAAAAAKANIRRSTIYEWLQRGHPFAEALQMWKQDLAATARTRLLMLTDQATSAVALALRRGDSKTALRLLERIGILAAPPIGETHIEARTKNEQQKTIITITKAQTATSINNFFEPWQHSSNDEPLPESRIQSNPETDNDPQPNENPDR
jgi:hypothetical protein